MKTCIKCKKIKTLDSFNKDSASKDGFRGKCKECRRFDTKKYRLKNSKLINEKKRTHYAEKKEEIKERIRKYYSENKEAINEKRAGHYLDNSKKIKEYQKKYHSKNPKIKIKTEQKYNKKYPEKIKAKIKAQRNIDIKTKGNHRHHWSYNEEHYLDVIELSEKDHNTAHRFMIYDQERRMYRTLKGELLDTKEGHLLYISIHLNK